MDSERVAQIEGFAEAAERTRRRWLILGMQNIHGITEEERIAQAKTYAVAEAEMNEAASKLRAATSFP